MSLWPKLAGSVDGVPCSELMAGQAGACASDYWSTVGALAVCFAALFFMLWVAFSIVLEGGVPPTLSEWLDDRFGFDRKPGQSEAVQSERENPPSD